MSWQEFEEQSPDLAALGRSLLDRKISYLATLKGDGAPRLHPIRPIIGKGHLFVFIDQSSPKRNDLLRDGRYGIHCSVSESNGLSPEFMVSGVAENIENSSIRQLAMEIWGSALSERYALFDFSIKLARATEYTENRQPIRYRWKNEQH